MQPLPQKRRWFSFSLRRMLVVVALLSVMLAVGRWAQHRVYGQHRIVRELVQMGGSVFYSDDSFSFRFQKMFGDDVSGIDWIRRETNRVAKIVHLSVPFRTEDEAIRANELIRQLPHVVEVWILRDPKWTDRVDFGELADRQAAIAIQGFPIRKVVVKWAEVRGGRLAAELGKLPNLSAVEWDVAIPASDVQLIVANKNLRNFHVKHPDEASLAIISSASHLNRGESEVPLEDSEERDENGRADAN